MVYRNSEIMILIRHLVFSLSFQVKYIFLVQEFKIRLPIVRSILFQRFLAATENILDNMLSGINVLQCISGSNIC